MLRELAQATPPSANGMGPGEFAAHHRTSTALAESPDGKRAVTASEERVIRIWAVPSQEMVAQLPMSAAAGARILALSPDGKRLLAGCREDGSVYLYDILRRPNEPDVIQLARCSDSPRSLAFAPDSRSFVVGTDRGVVLRFEIVEER